MKYNIISTQYLTRKEKIKNVFKWTSYSVVLLLFYMLMTSGVFKTWQPIWVIPLASAVAMYENELSGVVFALFCGLLADLATGNAFGLTAAFLIPLCLVITLLVRNYMKQNVLNHFWFTIVVVFLLGSTHFFFGYVIWETEGLEIVFRQYVLPTHLSTIILAPLPYAIVKRIWRVFEYQKGVVTSDKAEEEEEKAKNHG